MYVPCFSSFYFVFHVWTMRWGYVAGLCPSDVQNYIPLCCGLLCGQSADVWHGNGFYKSFIMLSASKDWVSIELLWPCPPSPHVYSWMFVTVNLHSIVFFTLKFSLSCLLVFFSFVFFNTREEKKKTMKNNEILKTLKSNLLLVQDVI